MEQKNCLNLPTFAEITSCIKPEPTMSSMVADPLDSRSEPSLYNVISCGARLSAKLNSPPIILLWGPFESYHSPNFNTFINYRIHWKTFKKSISAHLHQLNSFDSGWRFLMWNFDKHFSFMGPQTARISSQLPPFNLDVWKLYVWKLL